MNSGRIERMRAAANAQESGSLLERLCAQSRYVQEIGAGAEPAARIACCDDAPGKRGSESRHVRQQRYGCCIYFDADTVHTALDHVVQPLLESCLADVVLILADSDRLRVDLHELCQRVLQPARDRRRAAQG